MKCPKCQFDNRAVAKFCKKCGAKLELVCPACKCSVQSDSVFCDECGHNLSQLAEKPSADLSFDEKIEKIQRYLPQGLTDKILTQRDKIEGERKTVTVMFCDMQGFTTLSERLGPEEAYTVMDDVYEILIHKVHDYEGTVNEMTGDGIMALFGAPIALEDAPQRALRSSLAIHRAIAKFSNQLRQENKIAFPLRMRTGIHTGPVVVGTLGNDLRVEFKAVGDTVNLASRMETLAEPGTTFVTVDTFKLTEGLFRFESLGEKEIKGKQESIRVYQVIGPSTRRTRFDVSADQGLSPFVGRERELELLRDSFERVRAGRGQAVSIVAEAGLGKSRLLYEFRKSVANEDVTFLEGRCLSYSQAVAFHLHMDLLRANFDIREGDGDANIKEKVLKGLNLLNIDITSTLPLVLSLLGVQDSGLDQMPMSTEGRKDQILEALKQIVLKGSEIRSLILAYEDLHWIDKDSEDVLKAALEIIPGARILLIFTYRPKFLLTWGGKSYHSQVTLNRLANRESLALATHLLGTENIDSDLEDLVLKKTDGIPFFIEEFVKSLKDLAIIEKGNNTYYLAKDFRGVTIPSTIQDVIMARVDSLPEAAKEVLRTGSVIEREFSHGLIKQVMDLPENELLTSLAVLKDSELLYERGIFPNSIYVFKHALTREVVCDSLLTKSKKILHEKIGNAIEALSKDSIKEHYEVLSEHYLASQNYDKAAKYSKLVALKAGHSGSLNKAIEYTQKLISCLEKSPRTEEAQQNLINARTKLGLYFLNMNFTNDAKDVVDLALAGKNQKIISQIFTIMGAWHYFVNEDFQKSYEHLNKASNILKKFQDPRSLVVVNSWAGQVLAVHCEFEKASDHFEEAISFQVQANNKVWVSVLKGLLSMFVYCPLGKIHQAYETSREAVRIADDLGDIYPKTNAYICHGIACLARGRFKEAQDYLRKGIYFRDKMNSYIYGAVVHKGLSDAYYQTGNYQGAINQLQQAIWFMENKIMYRSWLNLCKIALARAKVMNNEPEIDLAELYGFVSENRIKSHEGRIRKYIAEILLGLDGNHLKSAKNWILQAIEADKINGLKFFLARDYALLAEINQRRGEPIKANESMDKAIKIFKECGADGWVEKYTKDPAVQESVTPAR
jgi:class 3 adenylate cyclase/tetratricopeptide (TPR) repeat protein